MKKSTALLIILFVSIVYSLIYKFLGSDLINKLILELQIPIYTIGYFIVKQLEETKSN